MDLDETYLSSAEGIDNAHDLTDEVWGLVRDLQDGLVDVSGAGVAYSRLGVALEYLTRAKRELQAASDEIENLRAAQEEGE